VAAATVICSGRPALAYRPFDGTDADVVSVGEFELELGPLHYLRKGHADFLIVPAAVLNLGISKRGELVADLKNFISLDGSDTGLRRFRPRDADLLFKAVLQPGVLQDASGPSIALETGVLLPTPETQTGVGAQANAIVSFATPDTALHLNEAIAGNRDHRFEVFSSAILEFTRQQRIRPVAEAFFDHVLHGGDEYSALVGAVWAPSHNWIFDSAVRGSRADRLSVLEIRLGFTWTTRLWAGTGQNDEE
jgi:hypothetical protein